MNTIMSPKVIAAVATALFFGCLIAFFSQYQLSNSLEGNLKDQKLRAEALLSEKLSLEKSLARFKAELASMEGINSSLDKQIAETTQKLTAAEAAYRKAEEQNASLANYKRQHDALVAVRKELEQGMENLQAELRRVQSENNSLNGTIANLERRNSLLQQELHKAMFASLDQPRIETVKGKKDKLTVSARRTKKMKVNVEVPVDMKAITFRIKNPDGQVLRAEDGTIATRVLEETPDFVASAGEGASSVKAVKRIEMVYNPVKRLTPGIYTVEILNENLYVGSMQVSLR